MFADINGKQVKSSSAINALYDRRDPFNAWALSVMSILPGVGTRIEIPVDRDRRDREEHRRRR